MMAILTSGASKHVKHHNGDTFTVETAAVFWSNRVHCNMSKWNITGD